MFTPPFSPYPPITTSLCPEWIQYSQSDSSMALFHLLYTHSLPRNYSLHSILTSQFITSHITQIMDIVTDPVCRNRELLRMHLLQLCQQDPNLSLSILLFTTINWTQRRIRDNYLFIQKIRLIAANQIDFQSISWEINSDIRPLHTRINNTISFFDTLFSLSSFLYSIPIHQRQSLFTLHCGRINQIAFQSIGGVSFPIHPTTIIKRIIPSSSFVLSTKSRCPCVVDLELQGTFQQSPTSSESWIDWLEEDRSDGGSSSGSISPSTDTIDSINTNNSTNTIDSINTTHHRIIIKTNDFMRQEEMASNLIHEIQQILTDSHIHINLHPYSVIPFNDHNAIIDYLEGFISFHQLKRTIYSKGFQSIHTFFNHLFQQQPQRFNTFQHNFITSIAAYSIISFVLQLKDRNDGNILIDQFGNVVHIDYGFFLSNSPGNIHFETAPFKLNNDFIQLIGIPESSNFLLFQTLCTQIYNALVSHQTRILSIVKLFAIHYPHLPCFSNDPQQTIQQLTLRLNPQIQTDRFVQQLIQQAFGSWTTHLYDSFQFYLTG
ncbi:hypothetical protein WA538_002496, partial [Blastocystis sp. DL]